MRIAKNITMDAGTQGCYAVVAMHVSSGKLLAPSAMPPILAADDQNARMMHLH